MAERSSPNIRVLICDFHTMFRDGVSSLITQHNNGEVVGEAGNQTTALAIAKQTQPDIILLELNLDGVLKLDVIPKFLEVSPTSRIILVTGIRESQVHHKAIEMGVMGVVLKEQSAQVLLKAIKKVHEGEVWIDRTMMADLISRMSRGVGVDNTNPESQYINRLTDREREVIKLIGKGMKNKQIAEELSISEVTVRHHLTSIYSKLNVSDRLELIVYAYRNQLAELPT